MSELIRREDVQREIQASFDGGAFRWQDGQDLMDRINALPTIPAPRWRRVEESPKEHGPFLCASKYERNGQTHWFFELCWYADGDLKNVVFDAEQDSGFYSWSAYQDRDIDAKVNYWMSIEPPKEDA